jgi:hypothetical protein
MKVSIEDISVAARKVGIEERQSAALIEQVAAMNQPEPKEPSEPREYRVLTCSAGFSEGAMLAYLIQTPADKSYIGIDEKLAAMADEYNATPKGKRCRIESLHDLMELVPSKIAREHGVSVKTREPIYIYQVAKDLAIDQSTEECDD